ncbi:DNA helicase UvrD [Candidatus Bathyarchaeota archaeon]|nr:DNA helicase UvrD [Candidatus Bathyarchaeota archaeon]
MRVFADLHIHSRYSRATSPRMNLKEIAYYAQMKGLNLVGSGDFTHPKWFNQIKEILITDPNTNLYKVNGAIENSVQFMLTTEVCTLFNFENSIKKIHHVIFAPNLEVITQINSALEKYGNLNSDGRPILKISCVDLVEKIMDVSKDNLIFPAHIWTPWFGILGAFSGFNNIEDCYQDMIKYIYAIESGLSSDPPMNWRLSNLDKFTLLSNSDCHSFWPWRIGREANVFDLEKLSYREVIGAIKNKPAQKLKFTIETDPGYGKYHWTGHRNCKISLSPKQAKRFNNICPVCRKKLTKGVEQRVDELADQPINRKPKNAPSFLRLLPLSNIITEVLNVGSPSTQAVWKIYSELIRNFHNEYFVLIEAPRDDLLKIVDFPIANAILKVREGDFEVIPGFDGVYGQLVLDTDIKKIKLPRSKVSQTNIHDFNKIE